MRELHQIIPDPDAVLALEPEELAGVLLSLLRKRLGQEGAAITTYSLSLEILRAGEEGREHDGYPADKRRDVALALSEAFAWLESQALLVPQPGSQHPIVKMLSRRARTLESKEDFQSYIDARRLNRDLLHPEIAEGVWLAFMRGEFAEAVFKAMRAVEIAVREAGDFEPRDIGTSLMRKAFGKTGPLRDSKADPAEADALEHLFAGTIGSYKNPHSHRNVPMNDAVEAIEIVMLASHLLRIVDSRRPVGRAA